LLSTFVDIRNQPLGSNFIDISDERVNTRVNTSPSTTATDCQEMGHSTRYWTFTRRVISPTGRYPDVTQLLKETSRPYGLGLVYNSCYNHTDVLEICPDRTRAVLCAKPSAKGHGVGMGQCSNYRGNREIPPLRLSVPILCNGPPFGASVSFPHYFLLNSATGVGCGIRHATSQEKYL